MSAQRGNDPVDLTLQRLGYYPALPQRSLKGIALSDQQYDDYVRISGRLSHYRLLPIVQTPWFNRAPPEKAHDIIRDTIEQSRRAAASIVQMHALGSDHDILRQANRIAEAAARGEPLSTLKEMRTAP